MQHYLSDISRCVAVCNVYWKLLTAFPMILKQMTLKVYNVWKHHWPRMLHGLLADSVDTTLASLLYRPSCTTDAAFSEVHDQWASRERRAWLTRCLSAVAELLVITVLYNIYTSLFIRNTDWTKKKKNGKNNISTRKASKHQKAKRHI